MYIILGLLIVAVIAYQFLRHSDGNPQSTDATVVTNSEHPFVYLSNGLIFQRSAGGEVVQVHSPYAQEVAAKQERAQDRHGWKQGTSFNVKAGGKFKSFAAVDQPVQATSVTCTSDGDLFYFLTNGGVGGLFRFVRATGQEFRLMLRQRLHLSDLTPSSTGESIAAASRSPNGTSSIVILSEDGNLYRELTGGDTIDSSPSWVPGMPKRLLFQSIGLARSSQGYVVAQGHASIQLMDMESGTVSPVLSDARFDFLRPRVCPSGDLHFIRRPFGDPEYGTHKALTDTLLFPFRLLRAVFHYLNIFSLMYTNKPLTSASGMPMQADMEQIMMQGRRIDAEKASRSWRPVHGVPSLVPPSWELVKRDQQGKERVLASSVATYDIASDGTILYSNGRGVFVIEPDGKIHHAYTGDLIGEVVATCLK